LRSAQAVGLPQTSPAWQDLDALEAEHRSILAEVDKRYRDFQNWTRGCTG
jgi:hypothetical protein